LPKIDNIKVFHLSNPMLKARLGVFPPLFYLILTVRGIKFPIISISIIRNTAEIDDALEQDIRRGHNRLEIHIFDGCMETLAGWAEYHTWNAGNHRNRVTFFL
jgi:hypothetical protein